MQLKKRGNLPKVHWILLQEAGQFTRHHRVDAHQRKSIVDRKVIRFLHGIERVQRLAAGTSHHAGTGFCREALPEHRLVAARRLE